MTDHPTTERPHYIDTALDCSCSPLRLTIAPDGSITRIAGGPLEEPIDTAPPEEHPDD